MDATGVYETESGTEILWDVNLNPENEKLSKEDRHKRRKKNQQSKRSRDQHRKRNKHGH
jgi:hypothetical protein